MARNLQVAINTSTAKETFSFSKADRFTRSKDYNTRGSYDITSLFDKDRYKFGTNKPFG